VKHRTLKPAADRTSAQNKPHFSFFGVVGVFLRGSPLKTKNIFKEFYMKHKLKTVLFIGLALVAL